MKFSQISAKFGSEIRFLCQRICLSRKSTFFQEVSPQPTSVSPTLRLARQDLAAGFAGALPGLRLAPHIVKHTRATRTSTHRGKHTRATQKIANIHTTHTHTHTQRGRSLRSRQQQYRWGRRLRRRPHRYCCCCCSLCVWCECWQSFAWHACAFLCECSFVWRACA